MQDTIDRMSKKEVLEAVERVGCDVEDLNELMADANKEGGRSNEVYGRSSVSSQEVAARAEG